MEIQDQVGSIAIGKKANFSLQNYPSYQFLHYSFGENLINKVFLEGNQIK